MATQPTTARGESTRRRILDVAARHFLERGFTGTSLNEVIRDSEITKGGFYFHFSSKADLAVEALELVRTEWRGEVLATAGYHPRAVAQLAALFRAAAAGKRTAPAGTAIGRLCEELARQPEVAERVRPLEPWFESPAEALRRAVSRGPSGRRRGAVGRLHAPGPARSTHRRSYRIDLERTQFARSEAPEERQDPRRRDRPEDPSPSGIGHRTPSEPR